MIIKEIRDLVAYAAGIMTRRRAFKGPHYLQIDITNSCNLNCIGCYYHSELKNDRYTKEWKRYKIPEELFYGIIDDAKSINTSNILITGNGEPLVHPQVRDFIRYVKNKKMGCMLVTNGISVDNDLIGEFSNIKLDDMILSIWDYNRERYADLRPGNADKFDLIENWLTEHKNKAMKYPRINLLFLLNKINYKDIEGMVRYSLKYNIDRITFKLQRVYDEITGKYMLTEDEIRWINEEVSRVDDIYGKQMKTNRKYFNFLLEKMTPEGYLYLNNVLMDYPCAIGWFYSVVMDNGDVIPCCGCRKVPMGNIHKEKFSQIWNSDSFSDFRQSALLDKHNDFFRECNCRHLCSHYAILVKVAEKLKFLGIK